MRRLFQLTTIPSAPTWFQAFVTDLNRNLARIDEAIDGLERAEPKFAGNIDANGHRVINLGKAVADGDAVPRSDLVSRGMFSRSIGQPHIAAEVIIALKGVQVPLAQINGDAVPLEQMTEQFTLSAAATVPPAIASLSALGSVTTRFAREDHTHAGLFIEAVQSVADAAAIAAAVAGSIAYLLVTVKEDNACGIFVLQGGLNAVVSFAESLAIFSTVAGTVNSINVYWSGGNNRYEIENRRGGVRNIRYALLGTPS